MTCRLVYECKLMSSETFKIQIGIWDTGSGHIVLLRFTIQDDWLGQSPSGCPLL